MSIPRRPPLGMSPPAPPSPSPPPPRRPRPPAWGAPKAEPHFSEIEVTTTRRPPAPATPLDRMRRVRRADPDDAPPGPPQGVWTEAKVRAVLESFRSMIANAATKHGIPATEVMALIRDHVLDPGD